MLSMYIVSAIPYRSSIVHGQLSDNSSGFYNVVVTRIHVSVTAALCRLRLRPGQLASGNRPRPTRFHLRCAPTFMSTLSSILADPAYHDYLAIIKGARNGFVYGVKVRFPHALIMAILFGRGECVCQHTHPGH